MSNNKRRKLTFGSLSVSLLEEPRDNSSINSDDDNDDENAPPPPLLPEALDGSGGGRETFTKRLDHHAQNNIATLGPRKSPNNTRLIKIAHCIQVLMETRRFGVLVRKLDCLTHLAAEYSDNQLFAKLICELVLQKLAPYDAERIHGRVGPRERMAISGFLEIFKQMFDQRPHKFATFFPFLSSIFGGHTEVLDLIGKRKVSVSTMVVLRIVSMFMATTETGFEECGIQDVEQLCAMEKDFHLFPYDYVVHILEFVRGNPGFLTFSSYIDAKELISTAASSNSSPKLKELYLKFLMDFHSDQLDEILQAVQSLLEHCPTSIYGLEIAEFLLQLDCVEAEQVLQWFLTRLEYPKIPPTRNRDLMTQFCEEELRYWSMFCGLLELVSDVDIHLDEWILNCHMANIARLRAEDSFQVPKLVHFFSRCKERLQ